MTDYEAVQFKELGQWHAVLPDRRGDPSDRTFCGRNSIMAQRMYEKWSERADYEQCQQCQGSIAKATRMTCRHCQAEIMEFPDAALAQENEGRTVLYEDRNGDYFTDHYHEPRQGEEKT